MKLLEDLKLPTNPEYQWDQPEGQVEYANPVTLNNRVVELANASLKASQALVVYQKRRGEIRVQQQAATHALEDFEHDLLVQFPPPPNATKSNRLLQTYLRTVATHHGKAEAYAALRKAVREAEANELEATTRIEVLRTALQAIQTVADNVQTHLSYVKAEKQHGRYA